MTAVIEENDVREYVVLDEDIPESCDDKNCDRVAVWIVTMACCGTKFLFCQEHFDSILEDINDGWAFYCTSCKTGNQKQPIYSAEKIKA